MILVGSRCGGHDFFVELSDAEPIWIGAKESSDLDLIIQPEARQSIKLPEWVRPDFYYGNTPPAKTPYSIGGELFIPKDLNYLQRVAKRRIRHKYGINYVKSLWDKELNFLNKDGSFFARLKITRHIYK